MGRRLSASILLFFLTATTTFAQTPSEAPSPEIARLIQKLLDRIDSLEKRVAELEGRPTGEAETAKVEAPPPPVQPIPNAQVEAEARVVYPNLKFRGFTDVNFAATDQTSQRQGFDEGQFVLHLSSALSPRISFFGELALTATPDDFRPTVERSIIRFDQSDYLKVSFGRYHTPINWWNANYHHGLWLQTTITRPEMSRIGGRFIPIHFVGALVEGTLPANGLNLTYNLGVGNGRSDEIGEPGDAGDVNSHRAWLGNFFIKPIRPFGLQTGGSVYRDRITLGDGRDFREWIASGNVVWLREDPEIIAEFSNIRHSSIDGGEVFDSQGFYIQVGYRLPWRDSALKPYYRYEYIDVAIGDPVFLGVPNLRGSTVGFRYDLSFFAALKAEFRHLDRLSDGDANGGFMQISFTF